MFIFLIVLSWICIYGMKFSKPDGFNENYLSRNDTTAVKGIFVFLVFMSHFIQYYDMNTVFDNPYKLVRKFLGQLVVVMFLFYSGYGIFESIKKKGTDYVKGLPVNRCLKVLFHLDLAVIIFLVLDLIIGKKVTLTKFLFSLVGWANIGNSNWFIFTIIILYLLVFISFMLFKSKPVFAIAFTTLLTGAYMFIMSKYVDAYWYNTALCFPLGMWYSLYKEKIGKFFMRNNIIYILSVAFFAVLLAVSYKTKRNFAMYELYTISFTLLVVLVTMKISFGNKVLLWLGNHVFSVYILQRIPMTVFQKIDIVSSNRYIYFTLCFVITVILAELFDRFTAILDKKLFVGKKR